MGYNPIGSRASGLSVSSIRPSAQLTLLLAAARTPTAGAYGDAVDVSGYSRILCLLSVTNADTDAGDTLDVYVDVSPDGGDTWLNAVHFTQVIGTASASKEYAVLDATTPGTSTIDATSDAAAGAVRPSLFGSLLRIRYVIVNAGAADASFTFGVSAYAD